MDGPGGARDSRFNLGYNMSLLSGESPPEIYGNPNVTLGRPPSALAQQMSRGGLLQGGCGLPRGLKRPGSEQCYDDRAMSSQGMGLEQCVVPDIGDDSYTSLQPKKSPPSNGKKTKGRVKIKMEYIDNKLRRYTTFSKRKTGIMKKAYELSTLTGTQVMLLVASETGHVYTFATRKLQPMITSDSGKRLIQTCLNSPDPPQGAAPGHGGDQRMSATGFEETELTYNIADEESKCERSPMDSGAEESGEDSGSEPESPSQRRERSPSPDGMHLHRDAESDQIFGPGGPVLYPPGVILSLAAAAQKQGGTGQPQFITIPLSMAMAAAAASQTTTTTASQQQHQQQQLQQQLHLQQQQQNSNNQTNGIQDLSRTGRK